MNTEEIKSDLLKMSIQIPDSRLPFDVTELRDQFAMSFANGFIAGAARGRMSIKSRIFFWLGFDNYNTTWTFNFGDIATKSYEFADAMLKAKNK